MYTYGLRAEDTPEGTLYVVTRACLPDGVEEGLFDTQDIDLARAIFLALAQSEARASVLEERIRALEAAEAGDE